MSFPHQASLLSVSSDILTRLVAWCFLTTVLVGSAGCCIWKIVQETTHAANHPSRNNCPCPILIAFFAVAFHSMVITSMWKQDFLCELIKKHVRSNTPMALRTVVYTKDVHHQQHATMGDDGTCAVCLEEFEHEETLRCGYHCRHLFHVPCINSWIEKGGQSCPYCRQSLSHRAMSC
jgi:hypothetical protein